jgi:hypothetical protein
MQNFQQQRILKKLTYDTYNIKFSIKFRVTFITISAKDKYMRTHVRMLAQTTAFFCYKKLRATLGPT